MFLYCSKTLPVPETILKARKRREENRNKALERHIVERKVSGVAIVYLGTYRDSVPG